MNKKKSVVVTVNSKIWNLAKSYNINISNVTEDALNNRIEQIKKDKVVESSDISHISHDVCTHTQTKHT